MYVTCTVLNPAIGDWLIALTTKLHVARSNCPLPLGTCARSPVIAAVVPFYATFKTALVRPTNLALSNGSLITMYSVMVVIISSGHISGGGGGSVHFTVAG